MISPSSHELGSFRGCKFLPPISDESRTSELSPLTESLGLVTAEESIPAALFSLEFPPGGRQMFQLPLRPRGSITYHLLLVCSGFIKSWLFSEMKSTFCGRHVLPGANMFGYFLFSFLTDPFILVHFMTPFLIFRIHLFCCCKTCLFRTSSDVADRNIFLLYSGLASKSIRYNLIRFYILDIYREFLIRVLNVDL